MLFSEKVYPVFASPFTFSAINTLIPRKKQFGGNFFGFGIMAPLTVKGTALKKHSGTDSLPVIY